MKKCQVSWIMSMSGADGKYSSTVDDHKAQLSVFLCSLSLSKWHHFIRLLNWQRLSSHLCWYGFVLGAPCPSMCIHGKSEVGSCAANTIRYRTKTENDQVRHNIKRRNWGGSCRGSRKSRQLKAAEKVRPLYDDCLQICWFTWGCELSLTSVTNHKWCKL